MKGKLIAATLASVITGGVVVSSWVGERLAPGSGTTPALREFPSVAAEYRAPDWWSGPVFELSQQYPSEAPTEDCPLEECPWKKFDPKEQSRDYLFEVLKYVYEGNLEAEWRQPAAGARWFHAPWMHTTSRGREFIHGLTQERTVCKDELYGKLCGNSPINTGQPYFENWAVSVYNARGAYYIRKVWEEMGAAAPDPKNFSPKGFPEGSVSLKLLFTEATPQDVPYLRGSVEWQADTKRARKLAPNEQEACKTDLSCFRKLHLLQVDVAVKVGPSVSPTGWVFGTFTYDEAAREFQRFVAGEGPVDARISRWLRVEPLGLMYGNKLHETSLLPTNTRQHLGCDKRLSGPVDDPISSCLSCHAPAEVPRDFDFDRLLAQRGSVRCRHDNDRHPWFRNISLHSDDPKLRTFVESTEGKEVYSLDYSLQLSIGIERCCRAPEGGCSCGTKALRTRTQAPVSETLLEITRDGVQPVDAR